MNDRRVTARRRADSVADMIDLPKVILRETRVRIMAADDPRLQPVGGEILDSGKNSSRLAPSL